MNRHYTRVIPRDLFNEAKLLKCVGRLALLIHDKMAPDGLTFNDDTGYPFEIALMDEGSLTIANLTFTIGDQEVTFKTTYNSKESYPFYMELDGDIEVFDDAGNFTETFKDACRLILEGKLF